MADDPGPGRRGRLSPNTAALLVLAVLGVVLLAWQRPWVGDDLATSTPAVDAAAALTTQFSDLSAATSQDEFTRAAGSGPAAATFAERTWRSRTELGAGQVSFRYLSGGGTAELPNGDTRAKVEIRWDDSEGGAAGTGTVAMRMRPQSDGTFDVVAAELGSGPLPVWLAGAVTVEEADGVRVVRIDGGDGDVDVEALAVAARRDVAAVVPSARDRDLTIVSTPTADVAGAVLGQGAESVGQIAAVSTRFDGRHGDLAGPVVVLNPGVFDTMDARATRVVMTHEATHVLTGAVGSTADTWIIEGFADFVALKDDDAPLSVSAGQVLAQVSADGPPETLPTAAAFSEAAYGLGAVYESAWLVFRMLGERFDDADVIAFYRSSLGGTPADEASRATFGLSVEQITADWQDYLTKRASTVS